MNINAFTLPTVALFVLIAMYWFLIFELMDHLLLKPRLTRLQRVPIGLFNALFVYVLSTLIGGTVIPYVLVIILLLVDFRLFYSDTILKNMFCTAACVVHVLAFRAITTGIFSMISGISISALSNSPVLYTYSVIATFAFLTVAVVLVIKFLPLDRVRIVNNHREQQMFMIAWLSINIMYLLFNSAVAEDSTVQNQIIAPCVILAGAYIMLFFAIKTGKLLDYREKNEELELTISKEQEYRSSITRDAVLNYEFNLSSDVITSGFENARDELGDMIYRYSDMLSFSAHKFVHPDDVDDFAKYVSPSNIKKEFERGTRELTLQYRRRTSSGEYIWCRAITTLVRDAESGDIHGFTYVKNIDTEKRRQMELQYKAERDSLTGLYNKGVTGKLIAEHLVLNHSRISSALFMIDVDNFKDVNDHFGHAYGDTVLCELGEKLRAIFRADDIIGRIGGDEYIVYMKSAASDKAVREKGDEICKAFRTSYVDAQDEGFTLSSSVGVAISPRDGATFDELYSHADAALYTAKKLGKSNCKVYSGEIING